MPSPTSERTPSQHKPGFCEQLIGMPAGDLPQYAENLFNDPAGITLVIGELDWRLSVCRSEAEASRLRDIRSVVEYIKQQVDAVYEAGGPVARQSIQPEHVTLTFPDGRELSVDLTALELAQTGKLDSESKIFHALRMYGINASVDSRTGHTSVWRVRTEQAAPIAQPIDYSSLPFVAP